MFFALSDPDPLVGGADPNPDPSIIKKNRYLLFCDFFLTFYLSNMMKM
jgi:hypothetical protein